MEFVSTELIPGFHPVKNKLHEKIKIWDLFPVM